MKSGLARFASLLALSFPLLCAAAVKAPPPSYTDNGFNPRMLDASVSQDDRLKLFARMMSAANSGQVRAQDLAGTMYWQGARIDGSPVQQNLDQARKLLANAAVNGNVIAMAKMAELELQAGRASQAMVWAQLFVRYRDPLKSIRSRTRRNSGYGSDLITRVGEAGGKIDETTRVNVAAMVSRYDEAIRRGIDAFKAQKRSGETFLVRQPSGNDKRENYNVSGLAEYMVEFGPDGKPGNIWLLDSLPGPKADQVVRSYLDLALANRAGADAGARYLKVSIVHSARRFKALRATH